MRKVLCAKEINEKVEEQIEEAEKYLQEKEYMKAYFKFNDIITLINVSNVRGYYSDVVFGMYRALYEYGKSLNKWNNLSSVIYNHAIISTLNKDKRERYTSIFEKNINDFYSNNKSSETKDVDF